MTCGQPVWNLWIAVLRRGCRMCVAQGLQILTGILRPRAVRQGAEQ